MRLPADCALRAWPRAHPRTGARAAPEARPRPGRGRYGGAAAATGRRACERAE